LPENALLHSAEPCNRAARALVQAIRLQLDTDAAPLLERMRQHQQLRFGIDERALPRPTNPGPPDLDPPIRDVDRRESSRPHERAALAIDRDERHRPASGALGQRRLDVLLHVVARVQLGGNPCPEIRIEPYRAERVDAIQRQRLQPHMATLEDHGLDYHGFAHRGAIVAPQDLTLELRYPREPL